MTRDVDPALASEIDKPELRPFVAFRIELPDPVYVWTGLGVLTFDDAEGTSHQWLGAGDIGSFDTIGESTDGSATGIKLALYRVPSEFREDIAQQAVRGALIEVYAGALDETYGAVAAVQMLERYKLDEYRVTDSGTTLTVEISGESRAIDKKRPAIKRFSDEYQQRKHPGDKFFEYVPRMTEVSILWSAAEGGGSVIPIGGGTYGGGNAGGFIGGYGVNV